MQAYNNLPNVFSDIIVTNGVSVNVLVYLPVDYKTTVYPAFWFWNGRGEDQGAVSQLAVWGPFAFINAQWQPNFIVFAVQGLEWAGQPQVDGVFTTLKARYNFGDVIASGLSDGGYGCTKLISYFPGSIASKSVKAIIPMSTAEGFGSTAVAPTIASGIAVWGFGDDPGDVHGVNTHNFIKAIVAANPSGRYKWTNMNPLGHSGWNNYYTPLWKDPVDGLTIYDWANKMLGQAVQPPPIPIPPVVVAKTIKTVEITYSDGTTQILP